MKVIVILSLLIVVAVAADDTQTSATLPKMRPLTNRTFERTPQRLQRGKYLAEGIMQCFTCHSEHDWSKPGWPPLENRKGSGMVIWDEKNIFLAAPNLTPDKETGAGTWTDDMLARAIREGIGHDGRALHPYMRYQSFRMLSDEDLASVIVYLRSLAPIRNPLPKRRLTKEKEEEVKNMPEPLTVTIPNPNEKDPIEYGKYLVRIADCMGCHTSWYTKVNPGYFAGGNLIEYRNTKAFSANLTPDPTGIPYYNDELFIEVMRTGKLRGAREISPLMPWGAFKNMNDADLRAVFAFLKTLPPLRHAINNQDPPTLCKLCGQMHGGGERNKPFEVHAAKIDTKLYNEYKGEYRFIDGLTEDIQTDGAHLYSILPGAPKRELIPVSSTKFYSENFAGPLEFFRDAAGKVSYIKEFSPYDPGVKIKTAKAPE